MGYSRLNIRPDASRKIFTKESEAQANESHRLSADRLVKAALEGLNQAAREKVAAKIPLQTPEASVTPGAER